MFHDTIRANLGYAKPGATEARADRGLQGRPDLAADLRPARWSRHGRRRSRLPAVRRREAADRAGQAAAQGAVGGRARRGDRASGLRIGGRRAAGAEDGAGRADLAGHRAPAVDDRRRPIRSWSSTTARWSSAARTPSCSRPAGCTRDLYQTQFASQEAASQTTSYWTPRRSGDLAGVRGRPAAVQRSGGNACDASLTARSCRSTISTMIAPMIEPMMPDGVEVRRGEPVVLDEVPQESADERADDAQQDRAEDARSSRGQAPAAGRSHRRSARR